MPLDFLAWQHDATGHVVDYGRLDVASTDPGVEQALLVALRQFKDMVTAGWPELAGKQEPRLPHQVWIDSGDMAPVVYNLWREAAQRFRPAVGRAAGQQRLQWYNRPTQTGSVVQQIGEGFHLNLLQAERRLLVEFDADYCDYWKTWVHERLHIPVGPPSALTLFRGTPQEHLAPPKHLTAETKTEEYVAGRGMVVKWERQQQQHHWLDALYNACAAGRDCATRIAERPKTPQPSRAAYSYPVVLGGADCEELFQPVWVLCHLSRARARKPWGTDNTWGPVVGDSWAVRIRKRNRKSKAWGSRGNVGGYSAAKGWRLSL